MPRLDAQRIDAWRRIGVATARARRAVDATMTAQHGIPLQWFEVLAALRQAGGSMRAGDIATTLGELPSTLSRRLDRMTADGLVEHAYAIEGDRRLVEVTMTSEGRAVWRDANVTFRRELQREVARHLTDTDMAALERILGKWGV